MSSASSASSTSSREMIVIRGMNNNNMPGHPDHHHQQHVHTKQLQLSKQAILDSAAIHEHDNTCDPINFWMGMWGKLIILGSVKRQGIKQGLNPEYETRSLNWDEIIKEVFSRTPRHLKRLLSLSNCRGWFEKRLEIYRERYPAYSAYESTIDELIRHYSRELLELRESRRAESNRLYWDNFHAVTNRANRIAGREMNNAHRTDAPTPTAPISENEPVTDSVKNNSEPLAAVTEAKMETVETVTQESNEEVFSLDKVNHDEVVETEERETEVHAVVKHNDNQDQALLASNEPVATITPAVESTKRKLEVHEPIPRKVGKTEVRDTKSLLLILFDKYTRGQEILNEMSLFLSGTISNGGNISCGFTLPKIKQKIMSGEVTDIISLMNYVRCLVASYLNRRTMRTVPKEIIQLQKSLQKAASQNDSLTNHTGEI